MDRSGRNKRSANISLFPNTSYLHMSSHENKTRMEPAPKLSSTTSSVFGSAFKQVGAPLPQTPSWLNQIQKVNPFPLPATPSTIERLSDKIAEETYDYVVVGGDSAVDRFVAQKLAEKFPQAKIALIVPPLTQGQIEQTVCVTDIFDVNKHTNKAVKLTTLMVKKSVQEDEWTIPSRSQIARWQVPNISFDTLSFFRSDWESAKQSVGSNARESFSIGMLEATQHEFDVEEADSEKEEFVYASKKSPRDIKLPDNVKVLSDTSAWKLWISDGKVSGINICHERTGKESRVLIKFPSRQGQIVLCNDPLDTVALLERSGIGNKQQARGTLVSEIESLGEQTAFSLQVFAVGSTTDGLDLDFTVGACLSDQSGAREWQIEVCSDIESLPESLRLRFLNRLLNESGEIQFFVLRGRLLAPTSRADTHLINVSDPSATVAMKGFSSSDLDSLESLQKKMCEIIDSIKGVKREWPESASIDTVFKSIQIVPNWSGQCSIGRVVDETSFTFKNAPACSTVAIVNASVVPFGANNAICRALGDRFVKNKFN